MNNLLSNFTAAINAKDGTNQISSDDLKSYYKSLDKVFDVFNKFDYKSSNGSDRQGAEQLHEIQNSIQNINSYISRGMEINERLIISTKNFDSYIERPSGKQKSIELEEIDKSNKTYTNHSDYSMNNIEKKDKCDDKTYLCVDEGNLKSFKKGFQYTQNGDVTDLAFFAVNLNNKNLYNGTSDLYKPFSTTTFSTENLTNLGWL